MKTIVTRTKSDSCSTISLNLLKLSLAAALAGALLSLLVATPVKADTNLLINPGFETGDVTGWTKIGPFTGVTGSGHNSTYSAYLGAGLQDNGITGDLYSQTIATTPGVSYEISFWATGDSGGTGDNYIVWNGTRILDDVNPDYSGWAQVKTTFTATTSSSTVGFGAYSADAYLIDDAVVAVQTPEPSAMAIGLMALVGFALFRFRK